MAARSSTTHPVRFGAHFLSRMRGPFLQSRPRGPDSGGGGASLQKPLPGRRFRYNAVMFRSTDCAFLCPEDLCYMNRYLAYGLAAPAAYKWSLDSFRISQPAIVVKYWRLRVIQQRMSYSTHIEKEGHVIRLMTRSN